MEIRSILIDTSISIHFKEFIQKQGITFDEMSKKTNTSPSHIFRVVDGQRPLSESLRDKLNKCLGTDF